jgi:hypothetical protein
VAEYPRDGPCHRSAKKHTTHKRCDVMDAPRIKAARRKLEPSACATDLMQFAHAECNECIPELVVAISDDGTQVRCVIVFLFYRRSHQNVLLQHFSPMAF